MYRQDNVYDARRFTPDLDVTMRCLHSEINKLDAYRALSLSASLAVPSGSSPPELRRSVSPAPLLTLAHLPRRVSFTRSSTAFPGKQAEDYKHALILTLKHAMTHPDVYPTHSLSKGSNF